ncbi:MAG: hypothetical protein H6722_30295 [Sandaracinus sp.]|nr:hypothetical protein [Myxococcales bacterium]MCB9616747.1 hypothetical protein [Sandaracinus sp.]
MDNKALWILGALLAVGGGYGACALSTSDDAAEELAVDPGGPDVPTMPDMPDLMVDAGAGTVVPTDPVVEPEQPTMPPPNSLGCDGACAQGQVCCPTTGDCVPADCSTCCSPDLTRQPVIPAELAPREDGPAGPMPSPEAIEGGGGVRPPGPDPRVTQ